MRTLLALFGYVKVPTEAIMLMMTLNSLCALIPDPVHREKALDICRTIIDFLRSGRKLSA